MRRGLVVTSIGVSVAMPACASPRDRPVDRSQPSASAPASAAPLPIPIAMPPAATAAPCATPLVVPPRHEDSFVDQAAASPAHDGVKWSPRPMTGPFPTRDLARPGCTNDKSLPATAPFYEIVACFTRDGKRPPGPGNTGAHVLVVRTSIGFWAHELARESFPHGRDRDQVRVAHVEQLTVADRLGDGGAEITAIAEEGPPGGAQTRHVFVCGLGPSGVPACFDVRVAAGGPFHGAGSWFYRLTLACDGTMEIAGWEGGSPIKLVHGRGKLAFP